MKTNLSETTLSECVGVFLDTFDVENINIKAIILNMGLSKEATKELLCELVDRVSENPDKPIRRQPELNSIDLFKEELVKKYNLTYSLAGKLIKQFHIERPEQLSYLTDDELLSIGGIGVSTLGKIRANFPYMNKSNDAVVNTSIASLYLPTKVEEILRQNNVLNTGQLTSFIQESLSSISYPTCLIIDKANELYEMGESDYKAYVKEYITIFIKSYDRNLNSLCRHSDEILSLYWIDNVIYHIITYFYEIMIKFVEYEDLYNIWSKLSEPRESLIQLCKANPKDNNRDIIKHYQSLGDTFSKIFRYIEEV